MSQFTDLDNAALADAFERVLWKHLLEPWYPSAIDPQGGFHQNRAHDWTIEGDSDRAVVHQSRLVWTAATVCRLMPDRKAEFAPDVRHGLETLRDRFWDQRNGGFYWQVGLNEGAGNQDRYTYGIAFGLFACSAAFRATADPLALELARSGFECLAGPLRDREMGGWFERLNAKGELVTAAHRSGKGAYIGAGTHYKIQNSILHVLEALAEYHRADPSETSSKELQEAIDCIGTRMFCEPGCLFTLTHRDWRGLPRPVSFGHDVEAAFLLVEGSMALHGEADPLIVKKARALIDHAIEYGFDHERGGLYELGEAVGRPVDKMKGWWSQAEAVAALSMATHRWPEDKSYGLALRKLWDWIETYQLDQENRGWRSYIRPDGTEVGTGAKGHAWKACYHEGRALIYGSRLLRGLPLH